MPLVVITGFPASGKSFRAAQIQKFFEKRGITVHLVSEWNCIQLAGYSKNEHFRDSQKEKLVRCNVKSEAIRLLTKDDLVIVDGTNYIKGFRYEIYCASKASRTTQCTIYCAITQGQAWDFNQTENKGGESYQRDVFDALCLRYEEPQANNRWDSPLFTIFPEEELDEDSIFNALFKQKALIPNLSTQNPPLSSTNFLFEMDKITQDIIDGVLSAQKLGLIGSVKVNNASPVDVPSDMNASQLNRLRRQFLSYMKLHTTSNTTLENIPSMFVQFVNSNCRQY
ncbi:protein KTI12 homolog [Topomyia yanbarensis]|uniref:protein KTI12 homolog n=1 Tax=Topomyia yanbarensis TaxID=2498891 RepID=UPI00273B5159|nr:protein KTI12 homolog [Topomyia yanbarensis]